MVVQVKAPVSKPDDLDLCPMIPMTEGKNRFPHKLFSDFYLCAMVLTPK